MRLIYLVLFVIYATSALRDPEISHDDLVKLTDGLLTGVNIQEDHNLLMKCLRGDIGQDWSALVTMLKQTMWSDPENVIMKFLEFNTLPYETFKVLLRCSKENVLKSYLDKMDKIADDMREFTRRVLANFAQLVHDLKYFLALWGEKNFVEAGKTAGTIIDWFFFK